jgi:L-lactate utilization protein LutB
MVFREQEADFNRLGCTDRGMTDQAVIETATRRLSSALDALEAAVERRLEADGGEAKLNDQVHALETDRSRLAAELDGQTSRARKLETVNRDIVQRLDAAIGSIRSVLDSRGGQ